MRGTTRGRRRMIIRRWLSGCSNTDGGKESSGVVETYCSTPLLHYCSRIRLRHGYILGDAGPIVGAERRDRQQRHVVEIADGIVGPGVADGDWVADLLA